MSSARSHTDSTPAPGPAFDFSMASNMPSSSSTGPTSTSKSKVKPEQILSKTASTASPITSSSTTRSPVATFRPSTSNTEKSSQQGCCSTIQHSAQTTRERRLERRRPQPYIVRKLLVPITLGILGYAGWVYGDLVCGGMIRGESRVGSRATGIAFLTVFCILYAWVVWAYIKVVITPPGFARDYVDKSERPQYPPAGSTFNFRGAPNDEDFDPEMDYESDDRADEGADTHSGRSRGDNGEMGERMRQIGGKGTGRVNGGFEDTRDAREHRRTYSTEGPTFRVSEDGADSDLEGGRRKRRSRRRDDGSKQQSQHHRLEGDDLRSIAGPSYEDLMKRDQVQRDSRVSTRRSGDQRYSRRQDSGLGRDIDIDLEKQAQEGVEGDREAGLLDSLAAPLPIPSGTVGNEKETTGGTGGSKLKKPVPALLSTRSKADAPGPVSSSSGTSPTFHPSSSKASHKDGSPSSAHNISSSHPTSSLPAHPASGCLPTKAAIQADVERLTSRGGPTRKPPTTPILHPAYRYCSFDEIVKPGRAHHCRACGTCILKYDHHCPWIGQCVGARNHKFFLNFCGIASVFCAWVFATGVWCVIVGSRSSSSSSGSSLASDPLSPPLLILLALSGLFLLFTSSLFVSHVLMIIEGQTTVESMYARGLKDGEGRRVDRALYERGLSGGVDRFFEGCCTFRTRRALTRRFDEEWGRIDKEGNIWWKGNKWEEWVDVMGDSWLGWVFPVGSSKSDGLNYPVNPRFDREGRWMRRSEWPEELR